MKKEPLIYDLGSPGRRGVTMPAPDVPLAEMPADDLLRGDDLDLPEVSEIDVVRHYLRLSHLNHSIDQDMYPLGSCTMKYNPKLNEDTARLPGLAGLHPYQDESQVQGALELMYNLQEWLTDPTAWNVDPPPIIQLSLSIPGVGQHPLHGSG